jgi:hypothetical protein
LVSSVLKRVPSFVTVSRATTSRPRTGRPASARPAPPRIREKNDFVDDESLHRPQTGRVTNVILDSGRNDNDDDEDSNFVVQETGRDPSADLVVSDYYDFKQFHHFLISFFLSPPPITYFKTVPLILDHSYLVGKLTSSKTADTKVSGFWRL